MRRSVLAISAAILGGYVLFRLCIWYQGRILVSEAESFNAQAANRIE